MSVIHILNNDVVDDIFGLNPQKAYGPMDINLSFLKTVLTVCANFLPRKTFLSVFGRLDSLSAGRMLRMAIALIP